MDYFNDLGYMNSFDEINDFNRFSSVENLVKFIKYQKEVIVYPVGAVGERFLDYLQYFNEIKNLICLTTYQTRAWNNTELVFSHNLPVIPLEFLVHMKETALIIVAAASTQHDDIRTFIQEFGLKKVVYIDESLHALITRILNDWYKSENFMDWFMDYVWEKLREMEKRIAEQNEVTAYNTAAFSAYQDRFIGKKIVIVANGPTMKDYEPMKDAIHIGLNKSYLRKDIEFDYLFAIDYLPELYDAIPFNEIKDRIFFGNFPERLPAHWLSFPENCFFNDKTVKFYLNSCARYKDQPMYRDICNHGLADFGSVVFPAIQFALWTHPKEIYLVGCDTTDTGHFYDEDDEESSSLAVPHWVKVGYARIKMFARLFYPNTEIISVNPVALKGLFRDIYTDNL